MNTRDLSNGILDREGPDYSDDPADRGGPTRWGITIPVLSEYRGCPASAADIQALTRLDAASVYDRLVQRSGFMALSDPRLHVLMVDWGVLCGVGTATMALQRILGVGMDGLCGPMTAGQANVWCATGRSRDLLKRLGLARQQAHVHDVIHNPEQIKWLAGWLNRNWAVSVEPL